MDNRECDSIKERNFDTMLESSVSGLPPEDVVVEVTPWRKSDEASTRWHCALYNYAEFSVPELYTSCNWNGAVNIRLPQSAA